MGRLRWWSARQMPATPRCLPRNRLGAVRYQVANPQAPLGCGFVVKNSRVVFDQLRDTTRAESPPRCFIGKCNRRHPANLPATIIRGTVLAHAAQAGVEPASTSLAAELGDTILPAHGASPPIIGLIL